MSDGMRDGLDFGGRLLVGDGRGNVVGQIGADPDPMHYSPGPPWPAVCGAGFVGRTYERERVTCAECLRLLAEGIGDE
jgi:hypothetical protein